MPTKKTTKEVVEEIKDDVIITSAPEDNPIRPITETFGNGDMNVLRDKINEIISFNN